MWVRPTGSTGSNCSTWFQFTHPCGCDWDDWEILTLLDVSIHAPVWVRPAQDVLFTEQVLFQFTHPCGCDNSSNGELTSKSGFNSRTRVGATGIQHHCPFQGRVSIHAPVWVRPACQASPKCVRQFQFTHPCGCDSPISGPCGLRLSFNSRTRVGATIRALSAGTMIKGFNSRTRVGATA